MKMLTCRELGGPCNAPIYGETAEEMRNNCQKHMNEILDPPHQEAAKYLEMMETDPEAFSVWNTQFLLKYKLLKEM